jgi:hypothetical protein
MNDVKRPPLIGRGARNPWGQVDSSGFAYPVVTEVRRAGAVVRSSAPGPPQPTFRAGSGPTDASAPA